MLAIFTPIWKQKVRRGSGLQLMGDDLTHIASLRRVQAQLHGPSPFGTSFGRDLVGSWVLTPCVQAGWSTLARPSRSGELLGFADRSLLPRVSAIDEA